MHDVSNIGLVDAHAVRDCRTNDVQPPLLPGRLDDAPLQLRHARVVVVRRSTDVFQLVRQVVGAGLGISLRHTINNTALAGPSAHEVDDGVADVLLRDVSR
jgi:hypothetical protein